MRTPEVVVGVGDGRNGLTEVEWAGREAAARGWLVRLVRAYHRAEQLYPWETAIDAEITADIRHGAQHRLDVACHHLRAVHADVQIEAELVDADPADALIERSTAAVMTVVGSRQLGAIGATVLGSVSSAVAARADGVVVAAGRYGLPLRETSSVVAGIDGRYLGDRVLAFAFDYAEAHHRPVHVVLCVRHPLTLSAPLARRAPADVGRARAWLADVVAPWQEKHPDIDARLTVSAEDPVAALARASFGQGLVVLGGKHRHAGITAAIGSTRQGVLHHATCPVAVVHEPARDADG